MAFDADRVEASGNALPGWWLRWSAILAAPAVAIGVLAYPDVQQRMMPLPVALLMVGLVGAAVVLAGHPRLLVLLPLVAAYMPSLQVGFAALAIAVAYFLADYGGPRWARPLDGLDLVLLAVIGWSFLSWLANLGEQTDVWALPVYALTFLSPWLLLFVARAAPWTAGERRVLLGVWLSLSAAQVVPALIKPVVVGMPEAYAVPLELVDLSGIAILRGLVRGAWDITTGTTSSPHHLGALLLLVVVYLLSLKLIGAIRRFWLGATLVVYVFLMTDSKHVIVAALPGAIVYGALVIWPRLLPGVRRALVLSSLLFGVLGGSLVATQFGRIVIAGVWQPVFVAASVNPKAQLYARTARLLAREPRAAWIGFGPGVYGSRAASARAGQLLFKEQSRLPGWIPSYTAPAYASVMYDLYTSEIVETAKYRSGVLTNPFSSLVGIVGETGVIGCALFLLLLAAVGRAGIRQWRRLELDPASRAAGATITFAVPFLAALTLFDTYLEQPDVVVPIVVLSLLTIAAEERWQPAAGAGPALAGTTGRSHE